MKKIQKNMGVWTNKGGGVPRVIEEGVRIKSPLAPSHCLNITYQQWPKENLPWLMARNVMKHIEHNWGSNILSIHDGIGPQFVIPQKKMKFS